MLCHVIMGNFRNHLCTIKTRTAMPNSLNVSYPLEKPCIPGSDPKPLQEID